MATLQRSVLCDSICSKIGLTRRNPGNGEFDKRELLHVNSALDLLTAKEREDLKGSANEKKD